MRFRLKTVRLQKDLRRDRRDELHSHAAHRVGYDLFVPDIVAFSRLVPVSEEIFNAPDCLIHNLHNFPLFVRFFNRLYHYTLTRRRL